MGSEETLSTTTSPEPADIAWPQAHSFEPLDQRDVFEDGAGSKTEPPISHRWKRIVVGGNALLGAAGIVVGNTSTLSVAIDGCHNTADAVTYHMQASDVLHDAPAEKLARRRKLTHWIITGGALVGTAKAGWDTKEGQEHVAGIWDLAVASASVALNGVAFHRLWRGMGGAFKNASSSVRDLVKHFALIDMPSAGLALMGSAVQNTSPGLEHTAAIASGVVGMVAFRPTKKNLAHSCLDHLEPDTSHVEGGSRTQNHAHHDHDHS